jgi:hypothetical protein
MITIWLVLFLGGLVHALALYGFDSRHMASLPLLIPILAIPILTRLKKQRPDCFTPAVLRVAGTLALLCGLHFLLTHFRLYWNCEQPIGALEVTGLGLGSLWVAVGSNATEGSGAWLWVGAWMVAGVLDPLLPLLGAGVGATAAAWGLMPSQGNEATGQKVSLFLSPFLLGLALPKPWWDWNLDPHWAFPMAALGFGAALASMKPLARFGNRLPTWTLLWGMGLLAILYAPQWGLLWGGTLGLLAGWAWLRHPRPIPLYCLAPAWFLGLLISFVLHGNVWLPGLRHLIWLGN